jgi:hypothetical protein
VLNYLDWDLSPEQQMIQGVVREFVENEALPVIPDAFERGEFPRQLIPRLGELGLLGPTIPQYGSGADYTSYGLICQELERGDSGLRSFVSVQGSLVMFPISSYGSAEQKARYLPGMTAGTLIGCFGLTEHEHGSDPDGMETRAVRDGDSFVLNGGKMWITNGNLADVALVWAKVAEDGQDTVRGFLVETDTPGFTANEIKHKLSLRASVTSELVLQDVRVASACMLPGVKGLRGPLSALNEARFGIVFGAVGGAMACYEAALECAAAVWPSHRRIPADAAQAGRRAAGDNSGAARGVSAGAVERCRPATAATGEYGQTRQRLGCAGSGEVDAQRAGRQRHQPRAPHFSAHGQPRVGLHVRGHARDSHPRGRRRHHRHQRLYPIGFAHGLQTHRAREAGHRAEAAHRAERDFLKRMSASRAAAAQAWLSPTELLRDTLRSARNVAVSACRGLFRNNHQLRRSCGPAVRWATMTQ